MPIRPMHKNLGEYAARGSCGQAPSARFDVLVESYLYVILVWLQFYILGFYQVSCTTEQFCTGGFKLNIYQWQLHFIL